jgi:hypothetical protein
MVRHQTVGQDSNGQVGPGLGEIREINAVIVEPSKYAPPIVAALDDVHRNAGEK